MNEDSKSAERQRLAAALRENLRRRKAATRPPRIVPKHRDETAGPARPDAAADRESKG